MQHSAYTFLLNFEGRTYLSQVHGETLHDAMLKWAHALDGDQVRHMDHRTKQDLLKDVQDEYPVALKGLVNVWMFVVAPLRRHGHVYFTKTIERQAEKVSEKPKKEMYTFIMNFEGGEYVSQVYAESVHEAVLAWGRSLDVSEIENMTEKTKDTLLKKLRNEYPNAVSGIDDAWSFTIAPLGRFGLVNLIKTDEGQVQSTEE